MILPVEKDYRFSEDVHLDAAEIEEIMYKKHPMQAWFVEQQKDLGFDDVFSLPVSYLNGFNEAYVSYKKDGKYNKGFATASFDASQNDPWFYCHFLGDPVMPGSQGQDIVFQLAGLWSGLRMDIVGRPRALEGNFNFHGQIFPTTKKVFYRMDVKRKLKKQNLLFFDGTVAVDEPDNVIYDFQNCKIGFFMKEQLGITQNTKEYYQPDWSKIKDKMQNDIDESKKYYDRS